MLLGITGGIGSGKSIVCRILEALGIPVFYADDEGRKILSENLSVRNSLMSLFGESAFTDAKPDRKKIADLVFKNKENLSALNSIIHPAVTEAFLNWKKKNSSHTILAKEAAILIETGLYKEVDKVLLVTAPEEIRIARVCKRDRVSAEAVKERIKNQMSDEEKMKFADYVIQNDEKSLLIPQIISIVEKLKNQ